MPGEAWAAASAIVSSISLAVSGVLVAKVQSTKTTVQSTQSTVESTQVTAEETRDLAAPTGNGFARRTTLSLERIEQKIDDHLSAHARHDLREHR